MPLWGKTDALASAPKYLNTADVENAYFVDTTEARVESNRDKGIKTPGWILYNTYTDANGAVRNKSEVLVPMKVSAADAGDAGTTGNTAIEDTTVADS
jgi:hypothetical protein